MKKQDLIINRFRESVTDQTSFIQQVANVLDISYDAAYRRIQGKAKLTADEAMELAKTGQFSLDNIMVQDVKLSALGEATTHVNSIKSMEEYLVETVKNLTQLGKDGVRFEYSAKDIPVYHHFDNSELARFKIYVWLQLMDPTFMETKYENFHLTMEMKSAMKEIAQLIERFEVCEIWNDTTVTSSLKQIDYFLTAGMLRLEDARILCKDIKNLIALKQKELLTDRYDIHYHELLIMTNNSIAYKHGKPVAGFVTMTMLGYIRFTASNMLHRIEGYFKHQLKQATSLSHSNSKERARFFNKIEQKINALEKSLERYEVLDF
ncbi:hypothetical protein [Nonlabens sp. Asnod2-A12]|uniref:hypothetical protein n=1 Tax=Nonlabens sp. Asnod2-A12 TaxID=3160578 RepID=UPI003865BAF4